MSAPKVGAGQGELFTAPVDPQEESTRRILEARQKEYYRDRDARKRAEAVIYPLPPEHPLVLARRPAAEWLAADAAAVRGASEFSKDPVRQESRVMSWQAAHLAGQWTPACAHRFLAEMPWDSLEVAA